MSELQLNAFFPAIAHTIYESSTLALGAVRTLCDYVPRIVPDEERCLRGLAASHADVVALLPLVDYTACEALLTRARLEEVSVRDLLVRSRVLSPADAEAIFSPENLTALGYDEGLYAEIEERSGAALREFVAGTHPGEAEHL
jgi:aspartate ammonia-lyase